MGTAHRVNLGLGGPCPRYLLGGRLPGGLKRELEWMVGGEVLWQREAGCKSLEVGDICKTLRISRFTFYRYVRL